MDRLGHEQCLLACQLDGLGQAVVNALRGVQTDSRMMVCVVVPVKEGAAEAIRRMGEEDLEDFRCIDLAVEQNSRTLDCQLQSSFR